MAWDAYTQARGIVRAALEGWQATLAQVAAEQGVALPDLATITTNRKPVYEFPFAEISTLQGPVSLEGRDNVVSTLEGWAIVYDRDGDQAALDERSAGYGTALVRTLLLVEAADYVLTVAEIAATPPGADTDSAGWVQAVVVRWRLQTLQRVQ